MTRSRCERARRCASIELRSTEAMIRAYAWIASTSSSSQSWRHRLALLERVHTGTLVHLLLEGLDDPAALARGGDVAEHVALADSSPPPSSAVS